MSYITQKKISQIFRQDVMQKGFKHVSVAQIMHQAQIRRQSFYDNFDDKYDLLAWTIQATMEDIIDSNLDYLPWQEIISLVFLSFKKTPNFTKASLKAKSKSMSSERSPGISRSSCYTSYAKKA